MKELQYSWVKVGLIGTFFLILNNVDLLDRQCSDAIHTSTNVFEDAQSSNFRYFALIYQLNAWNYKTESNCTETL